MNQTKSVYTATYDDLTLNTIEQELNALEQNPVNGWEKLYPTLYAALHTPIQEFCVALNCTEPGIFVIFQGINKQQACAYLLTDGTTQLHIGTDFIRNTLLNRTADNRDAMHRAFIWTLAHEMGHLADPTFKRFGQTYNFRTAFNNVATIGLCIGLLGFIPAMSTVLVINYTALLGISAAGIMLKALIIKMFSRRFEYAADAIAAQLIGDNIQHTMKFALTTMTGALRKSITNPYAKATSPLLRLYGWCYQKHTLTKLFFLCPSVDGRLKRVERQQESL